MPHLPAGLRGAGAAAVQAQLLPGLHRRGLGQGVGQPLPRMQQRLPAEAGAGEEPQAQQHRGEVQHLHGHQLGLQPTLLPLLPQLAGAEGVPALRHRLLPVARRRAPAGRLGQRQPLANRGQGCAGLELRSARRLPAAALRDRPGGCVPLLLLHGQPPWPQHLRPGGQEERDTANADETTGETV